MRARSSGVKEVVYLRLLPPFSFGCKAWLTSWSSLAGQTVEGLASQTNLGVRWETAAFGLPLVGSWLVENTDADC